VYSSAVFTGGRPLCTQILPGQGSSPINHSWLQKTRDTGLPNGEDRIPLRSLIWTQYRSVTDRQMDGYVIALYSACKASFAVRCAVKIQIFNFWSGSDWRCTPSHKISSR